MGRGLFPAVMAIGLGVFTSYYTFQPALRQIQHEKTTQGLRDATTEKPANQQTRSPTPVNEPKPALENKQAENKQGEKKQ